MMHEQPAVGRRGFLAGLTATGLVLSVNIPPGAAQAKSGTSAFGAFLRLDADGAITIVVPCVEMGQGSQTALAMIVADELGADWSRVQIAPAPLGVVYRTPGRPVQNTSGSQMVRRWNAPLRQAAATARERLVAAAAHGWGVQASACSVEAGHVLHGPTGRRTAFGELAAAAAKRPEPLDAALRTGHHLVGQSLPRLDIPAKVDGSAVFGIDVRLPGMVFAAIRQVPIYGATLLSVDEGEVRGRPGIVDVIKLPDAVAVVAESFWKAKRAVDDLKPHFSTPPQANIASKDIQEAQRLQLGSPLAIPAVDTGDVAAAMKGAKRVMQADYFVPFLHHATMEPMTCTAHLTADRFEFWVPTQNLTGVADVAVKVSGLPLDKVVVNATLLGGGFGRKFEQDFVMQAALIAKAVRRPVQLIWTREEDVQHGFYRPAMSARVTSPLDEKGMPTALTLRLVGPSVLEHSTGFPFIRGVDPVALLGVSTETPHSPSKIQQYAIGNFRAEYIYQPTHVPLGYWRSVGASENGFFIESFIDELAMEAKQDPYAFRRHLLRDSPRGLAVLDKAAQEAGWGSKPASGRHRGIAFSEAVGSLVAQVAEISMDGDQPRVHRVVCAIDCGTAVSPGNVVAQIEGCIVMGLSAAMMEQVVIEDGRCAQSNFHDYPVARLAGTPQIDVHIIESGAALGGVGEAGVPAVAPALCNAIFAATGRRIRSLPIGQA